MNDIKLTYEDTAQLIYETHERLAPTFKYITRRTRPVPWSEVPEPNKSLMIAVAKVVQETIIDKLLLIEEQGKTND